MSYRFDSVAKSVGGEMHIHKMSFTLASGGLNVLLGPTLAGKTSIMRLLAGLDRPTSGRLFSGDRDITDAPLRGRGVAMVYQQFINYPSFTVYENIASPLRRAGVEKKEVDRRVRELAAMLRIDGLLDRLPAELSGGQQQRTAIARALVRDADLLLLDEPLVNLDYKLREELRAELREIFSRRAATVVYATTEPHEALLMGGNALVLDEGRLLQTGRTIEVFRRPASIRVGQVFSDPPINLMDGRVEEGRVLLGDGVAGPLARHLAGLAPGAYRFGVRPNHLGLTRRGPDDLALDAVVELSEISGSETFVHVRHGNLPLVVQGAGVHGFELDQAITLHLDPARLFAFDRAGALVAAPDSARATDAAR